MAQDTISLEPAELELSPPAAGSTVKVTGKLRERINDEFLLFDCDFPFVVSESDILARLRSLTPGRDNVIVVGTLEMKSSELSVTVRSAHRAPTDAETYANELEALREVQRATPETLFSLAREISKHAARYDDESVVPVMLEVLSEAVAHTRQNGDVTAEEELRLAKQIDEILPESQRPYVINLLAEIVERHRGNREVLEWLRALNCRRYRGRWLSYEEFKQAEGFVFVDGRWQLPAEAAMERSMAEFKKRAADALLLRRRTDQEYVLLSERGRVEVGMTRKEVQRAIGFPDRVRRRAVADKEFDQWSYGEKYLYFYDGTLVEGPKESPGGDSKRSNPASGDN